MSGTIWGGYEQVCLLFGGVVGLLPLFFKGKNDGSKKSGGILIPIRVEQNKGRFRR